jgi:hypothetical protein
MAGVTFEKGRSLVRLARGAIEGYLKEKKPPELFKSKYVDMGCKEENCAVFVTLCAWPSRELRGCIGFPMPVKPLSEAVIDAALNAAFSDPRFPPLSKEELDKVTVEVSVLTEAKPIEVKDPREYPRKIRVGEDGLIIEYAFYSGLLLPQVAREYGWNAEQFLGHLCSKAGLSSDFWKQQGVKISKFQAQVFTEKTPNGEIAEE